VWEGDRRLRLGGSKQRSVLALLLLDTGSVVSSDRLAEEVWGDDQPDDAATALQQHVARLRKLLQPHDVLRTRARGYVLAIAPEQLDLFGTFNSPCAVAAVPELNRAPGGPLAIISPLNSFVGLTRPAPGVDPSLPAVLYPTGRRNYLRVFPTDDLQGAALALLARERGRKRVYVLDDGDPGYGALMATGFETAARRLGLEVAARESWDPQADGYAGLAPGRALRGRGGVHRRPARHQCRQRRP
jgi:hypothetical protein